MISPLLFTMMIHDVFSKAAADTGSSLSVDDGASWKRGRNVARVIVKVREAVDEVVEWGCDRAAASLGRKPRQFISAGKEERKE